MAEDEESDKKTIIDFLMDHKGFYKQHYVYKYTVKVIL